jgi:hypothetical protein
MSTAGGVAATAENSGKLSVLICLGLVVGGAGCGSGADHARKAAALKVITVHVQGFKKSESGAT